MGYLTIKGTIWDFPRIWGLPYFRGPYNKDPTVKGTMLRVPYFRKPPCGDHACVVLVFQGCCIERLSMCFSAYGQRVVWGGGRACRL